MRISEVLDHFNGNMAALARSVGVTRSAVHQWAKNERDHGKHIPEAMAYRIERITDGALKVDPSVYQTKNSQADAAA